MIDQHSVPNAMELFPTAFPNGGSQPRVCDFDDMVLRLVKWHPSNHGITATYSELAASRLGQLIEAPVVRGTVVFVDMQLLPAELAGRITQPFHVGFTFSPGHNFSEADYAKIENNLALPAAAVHLAWLQVGDQVGHNQYLYQLEQVLPDRTTRRMNHFVLIDQAFICGCPDWSSQPLSQPQTKYDLPPHLKSRVTLFSVEPFIDLVKSLDEDDIRRCFESYPNTWGIDSGMVDKVTKHILGRRTYLGDILRASLS